MNAPPHVLYIVGSGRSGSTLVERLLGSLSGWVNVGELAAIFSKGVMLNELCGCGAPFDSCPFWRAVGGRAFGGWDQEHARMTIEFRRVGVRERYLPMLLMGSLDATPHRREAYEYVRTFEQLYRAIYELTHADVIVDSSKSAVHGIYMSRGCGVDLRPLQLVRDPRGVAFSWSKRDVLRPQSANANMHMYSARQAAAKWNRYNFWASVLRVRSPSSLIRYEDFVKAPFLCLDEALWSLGLEATDLEQVAQNDVLLRPAHAIDGNPNRFTSGRIELRQDDAWRREFPLSQRCVVNAYTAPVRGMVAIDWWLRRVLHTSRKERRKR